VARVLVCGGAGFVGSHLVERLLEDSHEVDVVDDLSTGSLANLAGARNASGKFKFQNLGVTAGEFGELVRRRGPEVIVNLCSLTPASCTAPGALRSLEAAAAVLEAAQSSGAAKVVTMLPAKAIYGEVSARESPVKEGRHAEPRSLVDIAARGISDLHTVYRDTHAVEFTVLATGNVYGPRQRPADGVVAAFLEAHSGGRGAVIHGTGRQTRDFVYVADAVDAATKALEKAGGLVINVGTGEATAVSDLWTMIAGRRGPRPNASVARANDVSRLCLSPVRARIQLGWVAQTGLGQGIELTRRWLAEGSAE